MIPLTPQLRIALAAALLIGSALAGAMVNGWRLDGEHQRALSAERAHYAELQAKVNAQNAAVQAMGIQAAEADKRRALAESMAKTVLGSIDKRAAAVKASQAPDCAALLRESWGQP